MMLTKKQQTRKLYQKSACFEPFKIYGRDRANVWENFSVHLHPKFSKFVTILAAATQQAHTLGVKK